MIISVIEKTVVNAKVVYFGNLLSRVLTDEMEGNMNDITYPEDFRSYMDQLSLLTLPDVILIEVDENVDCCEQIKFIKNNPMLKGIIVILLGIKENKEWRKKALELKVSDYYTYPFPLDDFYARINFLVKFNLIKPQLSELKETVLTDKYQIPIAKRLFDILVSGMAILLLLPLFFIIALVIGLGSKGGVIYRSKRVGAGYKVFDFYKFRSMRYDADQMIGEMANLNQYAHDESKNGKSAFVKFSNDPRITKFGAFLRKTSLDELPQLVNVFIGDMSLVGNRPLPLYEAEQLTTNRWSTRFNGPAGLTGLWQITKRGQKDMSETERKELDNYYAKHFCLFLDLKIILKTFPALIQKETV
jgi:lipopolysaccharide/colanic/teichoic acid biosynthesis glycosyltransferase